MKKGFILSCFTMMILLVSIVVFTACSSFTGLTNKDGDSIDRNFDEQIYEAFKLYQAEGGTLSYEEWLSTIKGEKGDQGLQGEKGEPGDDGNGVVSIQKTATSGLIDTYEITFTDGTKTNFYVTNGNGIVHIEKTGTEDLIDTYTVYYSNGSTETFTVVNGEDGIDGEKGEQGIQGEKGNTGRGIVRVYINDEGNLVVVYTDETESEVGKLTGDCNCDVHPHEIVEKVIVEKEPTCTQTGITYIICETCREAIKTIITDKKPHDYTDVVTQPTCTEQGYTTHTCNDCGIVVVDSYVPAGHTEVIDEAVAPTCTETGLTESKHCSVCGEVLIAQEEVPALGHDLIHYEGKAATCTEKGWQEYDTCSRCDYTTYEEIDALGHNVVDGECTRCHEHEYTIRVEYQYTDGTVASDTVEKTLWEGKTYNIVSPVIENYTADKTTVSGIADANKNVVVAYTRVSVERIVSVETVNVGNVEYNTAYSELGLPNRLDCTTESGKTVSLEVYWNSSEYRPTTYGEQTISGLVVSTYGYVMDVNTAYATVNVLGNVITSINEMNLGKLPLGTDYDGLGLPTTAGVTTASGAVYYMPVTWNAYEYDKTLAGTYSINGTLTLESGFAFAAGVENRATITFELTEKMYGTADIVFIVDTTGSMGDEIRNVKNNINRFAETLEEAGVSVRWALLEYRDITCDGNDSTKIIYCGSSEWYINVAEYEKAIAALRVGGGGDCPETVIDALAAATYLETRSGAKTFHIVVTDADYKGNNNYGIANMTEMINILKEREIIASTVTKTTYYDVYRALTDGTGGILANIDGNFANELWKLSDLIEGEVVYGNVTYIEIISQPNKTVYNVGDYFDGYGMVVRAHYISGRTRTVTGYSVSPCRTLQSSDTYVEINHRGKTANVVITVKELPVPVTGVNVSTTSVTIAEGETTTVTATVMPTNATNKNVIWETMNPNVAVVTEGRIAAIGAGTTTVKVTTADGRYTKTIDVTVTAKAVAVTGVYVDKGALEMNVGESATITATVLPANATNKTLVWTSTNTSVVTVENGVVTAVGEGNATIKVTTVDGSYTAMSYVEVTGHDYEDVVTAPTCTEQGYTTHTCKNCGDVVVDTYVEATGHTEMIDEAVAPTCTETGLTEGKRCSVCGEVLVAQEEVPALGHNYVDGICTRCGESENVETEGLIFTLKGDDTYEVSGYTGEDTDVIIPSTHEEKSVTSVGYEAFFNCSSLTSITIPDSVTSIRDYAFIGCKSLTSITIPDSVTSIGNYAFSLCSSLTSITIPDSVTSVGYEAFSLCSSLTSITIPDSVTSIGADAFRGCSGLTSITIPDSVTSIGWGVFSSCSSLTSITVDNNNPIYHSAGNCIIKTKEKELVAGCKTSVIPTDGSVTSIGWGAFNNCSSLTSVTIPDSVTSIGEGAFRGCSGLTSITIPDSVTSIGDSAFSWCSSLTSITIGNSVTSIGDSAFSGCGGLESITVDEKNTTYHSAGNCIIKTKEKELVAGCKTSVIPTDGSVTSIGGYAFMNCSSLTSITIPDSVKSIGQDAFGGCSSLQYNEYDNAYYLGNDNNPYVVLIKAKDTDITSCTIHEDTKFIHSSAFYKCSSLTSITIPDSVTSIGNYAFYDCRSLTSITIPDSVKSIGNSAFSGCSSLTSITIGNSVTSIVDWAFYNCSSLTKVYYKGTEDDWAEIELGSGNNGLTNATRYYYSEEEPVEEGNYWHYEEDGVTISEW